MKLSTIKQIWVMSLLCCFTLWSVSAQCGWVESGNGISVTLKAESLTHTDVVPQFIRWTDKRASSVKVKYNMMLAQVKSPAERKREAEMAEQAAIKKLEELKKKIELRKRAKTQATKAKKLADIKKTEEKKLKKQAKLEKERQTRLKEEAQLKAEVKARKDKKDKQYKERLAQFLNKKQLSGHPCSDYDVNNQKQVLACLKSLDNTRAKNNSGLSKLWIKKGTCAKMKAAFSENLESMGFWQEAIDKRTPDCIMFADLYAEKFGDDIYWSKCLIGPSNVPQDIFDCIENSINLRTSVSRYPYFYKRNLEAAGLSGLGVDDVIRYNKYNRLFWKPVFYLVKQNAPKVQAKQEKTKRDMLHGFYYEETPRRLKSKYSDLERRLIKDNKVVVPANYAAPTGEEIRLAVMSSIVDRRDEMTHRNVGSVLRQSRNIGSQLPVVTDGHTIYLPFNGMIGTSVKFKEPENIKCHKRKSHLGYICTYFLASDGGSMMRFGNPGDHAKWAASYFTISVRTPVNNWFVLTKKGWRQPHTDKQISELRSQYKSAGQKIQHRGDKRYVGGTLLDRAALEFRDGMYIRGARFGRELIGLW